MKKILLISCFTLVSKISFSQNLEPNKSKYSKESETQLYVDYIRITDSLTKVYKKPVEGYSKVTTNDTTRLTIYYREKGKLNSLTFITTSNQLPNSGANRTVNFDRQ